MDESVAAPQTNLASSSIRQIFLQWERLRIWYNAVLVVWVLSLTAFALSSSLGSGAIFSPKMLTVFWPQFALVCAEGAVISNLCFFLGPIIESYVRWLGKEGRWLRMTLFGSGLTFTMLAAFVTVKWMLLPLIFLAKRES